MRLKTIALFAALSAMTPFAAQGGTDDPALHCAALITLSGEFLAADGQASKSDKDQVRQIADIMLSHSAVPKGKRAGALRAYADAYKASHSVEAISKEVQRKGDACIDDFVN